MSRKNLILLGVFILVAFVGAAIALYILSLKSVSFDVKQSDITVKVRQANGSSIIDTFSANKTIQLQEGQYIAVIEGKRFDTSDIPFEVGKKDVSVTIDPPFSKASLQELFATERTAITSALRAKYSTQLRDFEIEDGKLYKQGEWYATNLIKKTLSRSDEPDIYRVVLKKEDGKWIVKATPSLTLSAKTYPDIPFDILTDINQKTF